jgi:hypothetical protein
MTGERDAHGMLTQSGLDRQDYTHNRKIIWWGRNSSRDYNRRQHHASHHITEIKDPGRD